MYVNRHYHDDKRDPIKYLYSAETNRPCEIIKPIDIKFVYEYLLKHNTACLTLKDGHVLTFKEYSKEMDTYFDNLKQYLLEGVPVALPHFLGIIKIKSESIRKYNRTAKKYLPKKIITLHWENKFFVNRLINIINPKWVTVKIRDKEMLNKIYINLAKNNYLYSVDYSTNYYKRVR